MLESPGGDVAESAAWAVLASADGVGPVSFARLVERFGSATAVLERARHDDATVLVEATRGDDGPPTLSAEAAAAIARSAARPEQLLERLERAAVVPVALCDAAYPRRLRAVELPPPVLFVRGRIDALEPERSVAVVGTRRPTERGRRTATRIAGAIGRLGTTVVSGLAVGVDGAAHAAALANGGPTVAVIGGGHDRLFPRAHAGLAARIVDAGGAVVSEFPPDTRPTRGTFPRRNRVISGLADATVVVEAGSRSGALTTAAWALEQGRALFLAPGPIDAPEVAGSLAFLREFPGEARIVAGVGELLEDLGLAPAVGATRRERDAGPGSAEGRVRRRATAGPSLAAAVGDLGAVEQVVAAALVSGATTADELVGATGLPLGAVLGALTVLELRGSVARVFGRYRTLGPLAEASRPGRRPSARRVRERVVEPDPGRRADAA